MKDVIIADRQDITRIGMETLIEKVNKTLSIQKADNKSELIKFLLSYPEAIVVLDYTLSDFTSIDELLNLGYRFSKIKWLLFSDELSNDFLRRLVINTDTYSVVLKSCDLDEINMALIQILRGERFICNRVTNQLLQPQKQQADTSETILTATEKEILKEIALGRTTKKLQPIGT